jgi:protein gp37
MQPTRIEWAQQVWQPITGCSAHCPYCYAEKFAKRLAGRYGYPQENPFAPMFHVDRLEEPLFVEKGKRIFCCSMGDMFGPEIQRSWIDRIYNVMRRTPRHRYVILTKQPQNIPADLKVPKNCWIGVSVETWPKLPKLFRLRDVAQETGFVDRTILCIEPMLGPPPSIEVGSQPKWLILGAETGNRKGKITFEAWWVREWISKFPDTPVFMKNSLKDCMGGMMGIWPYTFRQEYPEGLIL